MSRLPSICGGMPELKAERTKIMIQADYTKLDDLARHLRCAKYLMLKQQRVKRAHKGKGTDDRQEQNFMSMLLDKTV